MDRGVVRILDLEERGVYCEKERDAVRIHGETTVCQCARLDLARRQLDLDRHYGSLRL